MIPTPRSQNLSPQGPGEGALLPRLSGVLGFLSDPRGMAVLLASSALVPPGGFPGTQRTVNVLLEAARWRRVHSLGAAAAAGAGSGSCSVSAAAGLHCPLHPAHFSPLLTEIPSARPALSCRWGSFFLSSFT